MRLTFFFFLPLTLFGDILALYLSWYGDPTTTISIQWHTSDDAKYPHCKLLLPSGKTREFKAPFHKVGDRFVYALSIEELNPDTLYTFQIESDETLYSFRTAPMHLEKPFRFVIGGDVFHAKQDFQKMCKEVIQQDPLFVVLGGDIAYATKINPLTDLSHFFLGTQGRWFSFLKEWKEQMILPDGRVVPFLLIPGNHDLSSNNSQLFFDLFAFPGKHLYRTIDFGNYLTLLLLDTGHLDPIEGEQTLWLENVLTEKKGRNFFQFPIYHIAAYPSYYSYTDQTPKKIRKLWCPLFDRFALPVAFENHNHTWKKTYPIRGEKIDPYGTIYLGDGCWGVKPRVPHKAWYLEKTMSVNYVYAIELSPESAEIRAISSTGDLLDALKVPNQFAPVSLGVSSSDEPD
ncbi:MAG TPA: metallophosphoesterase family protein [Chlamydiales bacterium]|nr:metallophosphoesterase family protein [Chlamydiales bacterium]